MPAVNLHNTANLIKCRSRTFNKYRISAEDNCGDHTRKENAMDLSWNIILDQLREYNLEVHLSDDLDRSFSRPALLPRNYAAMRKDLIHVCRLSDAMRANTGNQGMAYICVRDRIKDDKENAESLSGMIIVNENMEVELMLGIVQEIFLGIEQWYRRMQDALIQERSLQYILDLSETVIGNTINISDSAFTLLAQTENIETDDRISLDLKTFGYHPESTLQLFRQQRRYEHWEQAQPLFVNNALTLSKYVLVNRIYRFHNTYFTHVVMVCDHHPFSNGLLELFGFLTDMLAVYAERNWKNKNALSHNYDSFLTDLLSGELTRPENIEERARYLGLSTGGQMILIKLRVTSGAEASLGRIARELGELLPEAQILLYEQSVLALLHLHPQEDLPVPDPEKLSHFIKRHQATAAVSNAFTGLRNLPAAWMQASLALKYSMPMRGSGLMNELMPLSGRDTLCRFKDRVLYGLLGEYPQNEETWRCSCYYQALHEMWLGDREHDSNNLQLLRVYLWNERKATETGQALHMHRNNVIYRIGRIENMTDLDLNDPLTRLGLEMSFLMLEIYGFPEMYEPE